MFFDTHCHLTSKRLRKNFLTILQHAHESGVENILIPGTSLEDSRLALEIAQSHPNFRLYAAIGIHPEGISETADMETVNQELASLETLITHPQTTAVGEIGLDKTCPLNFNFQQKLFSQQLQLAAKYQKPVILHNRESTEETINLLQVNWSDSFDGHMVFHCCEPNQTLLAFAKKSNIFIGIDGDITYNPAKQSFIKNVPLELLVLETDAPYLLPEPLRTAKAYPNEPAHLIYTAQTVAKLLRIDIIELARTTTANAEKLFGLSSLR